MCVNEAFIDVHNDGGACRFLSQCSCILQDELPNPRVLGLRLHPSNVAFVPPVVAQRVEPTADRAAADLDSELLAELCSDDDGCNRGALGLLRMHQLVHQQLCFQRGTVLIRVTAMEWMCGIGATAMRR